MCVGGLVGLDRSGVQLAVHIMLVVGERPEPVTGLVGPLDELLTTTRTAVASGSCSRRRSQIVESTLDGLEGQNAQQAFADRPHALERDRVVVAVVDEEDAHGRLAHKLDNLSAKELVVASEPRQAVEGSRGRHVLEHALAERAADGSRSLPHAEQGVLVGRGRFLMMILASTSMRECGAVLVVLSGFESLEATDEREDLGVDTLLQERVRVLVLHVEAVWRLHRAHEHLHVVIVVFVFPCVGRQVSATRRGRIVGSVVVEAVGHTATLALEREHLVVEARHAHSARLEQVAQIAHMRRIGDRVAVGDELGAHGVLADRQVDVLQVAEARYRIEPKCSTCCLSIDIYTFLDKQIKTVIM